PAVSDYILRLCSDDGSRLYVDDIVRIDNWAPTGACSSPGVVHNSVVNGKHRIRVDYRELTGFASIDLQWLTTQFETVPGANLFPRYGLVTKTTADDTNATNAADTPSQVTASAYGLP